MTGAWPYRYLLAERTVGGGNRPDHCGRLPQGGPWKVSLRTLVTQSSHARNNLMSVYDWPGRRTAAGFAVAPDTGPAGYRLPPAAVSLGDLGRSRVQTRDTR
jgi:hypothetical protein